MDECPIKDAGIALAVLILRASSLSQDSVTMALGCGKPKVVAMERWFRSLSFERASGFANDQALKRCVERNLMAQEKKEPRI